MKHSTNNRQSNKPATNKTKHVRYTYIKHTHQYKHKQTNTATLVKIKNNTEQWTQPTTKKTTTAIIKTSTQNQHNMIKHVEQKTTRQNQQHKINTSTNNTHHFKCHETNQTWFFNLKHTSKHTKHIKQNKNENCVNIKQKEQHQQIINSRTSDTNHKHVKQTKHDKAKQFNNQNNNKSTQRRQHYNVQQGTNEIVRHTQQTKHDRRKPRKHTHPKSKENKQSKHYINQKTKPRHIIINMIRIHPTEKRQTTNEYKSTRNTYTMITKKTLAQNNNTSTQ